MQEEEKQKRPRAPDWEKYITDENRHEFVTYAKGARMYSLNYWTFVRLAKEAGANWPLRKTAIVDLRVLDEYMENNKLEATTAGKGRLMANKRNLDDMNEAVKKGRKFMRSEEAEEYFSVGRHTLAKWAKDAKAVYKINGVKLINIEKIERFLEAFLVEEDD